MSGGSYNYLCHKDEADLFDALTDLQSMAASLTSRNLHEAAAETEALIAYIEHARRQVKARADRLQNLWHAVEWHESCDAGPETVDQAAKEYQLQ